MSGIIGKLTGSDKQAKAANNAANLQYQASKEASQTQKDMYDQTRKDLSPYTQAGTSALAQIMGGIGPNGQFMQAYSGQDIYDDPSYQFRLQQGQDSIQSSAASQGGLLSGATQKALLNYSQEAASQEYNNAYNRFNADQTNQYNRLANLVGMGQNAAAQTGNAGMQTAQAVASNTMAGANAQAANQITQGNIKAGNMQQLLGLAGTVGGLFI